MAVKAFRALLIAQSQSAWNRLRHESGIVGLTGTIAMMVVAGVLLVPSLITFRIGLRLGLDLLEGSRDSLKNWNDLQAVFTLLFAILGSFRFKPALSLNHFGRYPLTHIDLATAELPAALFEAFPLLGFFGIMAMNAGLIVRMPVMAPLIVLLTLLNVLGMISLIIGAAGARRLLMKRHSCPFVIGASLLAVMAGFGWKGLVGTLRLAAPHLASLVSIMPGSFGYRGLMALRNGQIEQGILGILIALVATAGLGSIASIIHHRAMMSDAWSGGRVKREIAPSRYRGPAGEVAGLFFKQLLRNRGVRIMLLIPLLVTGTPAIMTREIAKAAARGEVLPEILVQPWLSGIPLFSITLYLAILMQSQIWMNQFGLDRSAIRAIMQLPMSARDILIGKFLGLLQFTLFQATICGTGLLLVYRPSAHEVIGGFAAAGIAFVVSSSLGLFVSIYAPRAAPPGGIAQTPLYLSWIPGVLLIPLGILISKILNLGSIVGFWFAPAILYLILAGSVLAWWSILPRIERWFMANREKLLSM